MKKIVYILIASSVLFSCKKKNVDSSDSLEDKTEVVADNEKAVLIQFSKSACYGKCPTYSVTITEDGMMDYNGKANMPLIGEHKIKARSSFASEILNKANAVSFFELNDTYDNKYVTDIPSTTLNIQTDMRSKSTYARHGVPDELKDLNNYIHEEIYKMTKMIGQSQSQPVKVKTQKEMKVRDTSPNNKIK